MMDTQVLRWGMTSVLVTAARSYPNLFRWSLPALPIVMLSAALADVSGAPPLTITWCLILLVPLIGSETAIDALELAVSKTSPSGRLLSLPDLLIVLSIGLSTALLPVLVLAVLGAAARGTPLPSDWAPVAYGVCFSPMAVAVVFFPVVEDWGRGYGLGESNPAAPIVKGWTHLRRAVSRWLRE
jgi:hypothetical protein